MQLDLTALLIAVADQPIVLAIALFVATFIVEDLATICAGLLVTRTGADPVLTLCAVILGTAVGDLALFALGRWGAQTRYGQRLRAREDVRRAEQWVAGRALGLVFAARFMPGFRLPVFTASGMAGTRILPVSLIIAITTPVWTGSLFLVARRAGETAGSNLVTTALPIGLGLAAVALIATRRPVQAKSKTI